jgi:transcriptional regulator with XRE-family HTH domain
MTDGKDLQGLSRPQLDLSEPFCHYAGVASPAITAAADDWARVAAAIKERRIAKGLSQLQLGVSKAVASNLENAKQTRVARSSLAKVSRALGWRHDSLERILAGDEPVEAEADASLRAEVDDLRRRLAAVEARLASEPPEPPEAAQADRPA